MNMLRHFLKRPLLGFGLIALACIAAVLVQVVCAVSSGTQVAVLAMVAGAGLTMDQERTGHLRPGDAPLPPGGDVRDQLVPDRKIGTQREVGERLVSDLGDDQVLYARGMTRLWEKIERLRRIAEASEAAKARAEQTAA